MVGLFKLVLEDLLIGGSCWKTFCQEQFGGRTLSQHRSNRGVVLDKFQCGFMLARLESPRLEPTARAMKIN
jgi:hypothetical protein